MYLRLVWYFVLFPFVLCNCFVIGARVGEISNPGASCNDVSFYPSYYNLAIPFFLVRENEKMIKVKILRKGGNVGLGEGIYYISYENEVIPVSCDFQMFPGRGISYFAFFASRKQISPIHS